MREKVLSIVFNSDISHVDRVIKNALEFLSGVFPSLSEDTVFEIRLVMSEALLNAVTHGNDEDRSKKVSLIIKTHSDHSITIQINDEGSGFDYETILERKNSWEDLMSETGRGVKLVNLLSDGVSYNKEGNEIEIYKKVVCDGQDFDN